MNSESKLKSGPARRPSIGETWKEWLRVGIPVMVLSLCAFAAAWHFIKPSPPGHVVIATGSKQGVYFAVAKKYAEYFAANGVQLEVRETAGGAENFALLNAPDSGVDVAIVQGGSSPPPEQRPHVQAVAGIYYEPLMIFYRGETRIGQLNQLAGKKIAIGAPGSGVRVMAKLLLDEAGVADATGGTTFIEYGGEKAGDALAAGEIDAAFYVVSPDAPIIARLLSTRGVHMMSFDQAHAYGRRHPFLSDAALYQGVVDVRRNLPDADAELIAAPATLVVRDTTHEAIIELLVRAAQKINGGGTLLSPPGAFPNSGRSELNFNKDALIFLSSQPSFLRRTLPFWLASLIDRTLILVVPLLVVLVPLIRMMPPLMRWRVQRRIFQRYKYVRKLEEKVGPASSAADLEAAREELAAMEKELATLQLPVSFADQLYNLRGHVQYVRTRFDNWLQSSKAKQ